MFGRPRMARAAFARASNRASFGCSVTGFTVDQRFIEARIQREASPEYQLLNTVIEEARLNSIALEEWRNLINEKLAKKERKKKKKKKKEKETKEKDSKEVTGSDSNNTGPSNYCMDMAENESAIDETQQQASDGENAEMLPSERVMQMEEEEKREQEEKKRYRDPPTVFKDLIDVQAEYDGLVDALKEKLNDEEQTCLDELCLGE
ncbi:protein MNN4-like [Pogonomyrmex barbatus]|uniref:Protein MNN4-like n=1 Tax=Pogonomyrmex barbatus TaxID=144034 RepID=A0A6I9WNC4_9HYME|nr:protein MNN4-like [Pogonomyrmex barbatus]XP_011641045.1 protein MNN4-like [Pogonomyrmex barbatus]